MDKNISPPSRFNRAAFPHLSAFMRGYLHEDFADHHRTALAAAHAFLMDAAEEERMEVAGDAERFAMLTGRLSLAEIKAQLDGLGGAWTPRSRAEADRVLAALREAGPDPQPPGPLRARIR